MIYNNQNNLDLMQKFRKTGHFPHACLFYGEKGSGRKTLAEYFAKTLLCTGNSAPCGECSACRKLTKHVHPDFISVEHSGKLQGFSVETIRSVCRNAISAPNESNYKIYLFSDCDNISIPAQNTLLKLTEEPPKHVVLLFTAVSKEAFLETMLSRMMQIPVNPCTPENCRNALLAKNFPPEKVSQAVQATGGTSVGMALQWLNSPEMQEISRQVKELTIALAKRQPYAVFQLLYQYEKSRPHVEMLLSLLLRQIRDALALKYQNQNAETIPIQLLGCETSSAALLSKYATTGKLFRMENAIDNAQNALQANVSLKLLLSALGGALLYKN